MSTLLELTQQGDVATITDESKLKTVKLQDPRALYALWERQQWQSHAIEFERDREDWAAMPDDEKADVLWGLSSFFLGEERVTTQFSGLVMAYDDQDEEAYLTTQQVDEARHAQFFDRFYEAVFAYDGTMDDRLERVRGEVNDAFLQLFDGALVDANRRLIADPSDREAKVDFVTTYHMVIEGTLALTGQNFITNFFEERGILPGFVEGFKNVARDEHRHVAYGTWFLQQASRDPGLKRRIQDRLVELLPVAAGVLVPKGADPYGSWELLGYTSDEVNQFAFTALSRRLKVINVELPAVTA